MKNTYEITGNTYIIKNKIKANGGKWNPLRKCWTVDLFGDDVILHNYQGKGVIVTKITKPQDTKKVNPKWINYNKLHNEGEEGFNPYPKYI